MYHSTFCSLSDIIVCPDPVWNSPAGAGPAPTAGKGKERRDKKESKKGKTKAKGQKKEGAKERKKGKKERSWQK